MHLTLCATALDHIVLIFQMFFLIRSFSDISIAHAVYGTSAMMFAKSVVPISFGDIGTRELSSIYFFSRFGIAQAAALNASLLLFVLNIIFPGIMGAFFFRHSGIPEGYFSFLKRKQAETGSR